MNIRESMDEPLLYVNKGLVIVYEDNYEDGELDTVNSYTLDIIGKFTLKELMKELAKWDFPDNPKDYMINTANGDTRLVSSYTGDVNNERVDARDTEIIKAWKKGEVKLYANDLSMPIQIISSKDLTEEDAKEMGFEWY